MYIYNKYTQLNNAKYANHLDSQHVYRDFQVPFKTKRPLSAAET